MNQNLIPVIIPAYEPDERLCHLLENLTSCGIKKIVVVDDGSGVGYENIFNEAENKFGATVIRHVKNRGKGAALKTAFSYCLNETDGLIGCVTADSDGQHSAQCILKCIEALDENRTGLILGSRDFTVPGVPKRSVMGNLNTNRIIRHIYGRELRDTQTGLRGLSSSFMYDCLGIKGDRFEFEIRMIMRALESGLEIEEVPIQTIYDSEKRHSTHFNPFLDTVKIYSSLGFFRSIGIILFGK